MNSTLTYGLAGDDQLQRMENSLLKKWELYEELDKLLSCDAEHLFQKCTDQTASSSDPDASVGTLSDESFKLACEAFRTGEYIDALGHIDEVLKSPNSNNAGMSRILRVKVMNAMEEYLEALRSIVNVDQDLMTFDLLFEGAKALLKLGLVLTAENMMKRVVVATSGDQEWARVSYELLLDIHTKRLYQKFINDAPVVVGLTEHGRGLFATTAISKGTVIFKELPELCDQAMPSVSISACSHCGLSLVRPQDVFSKEHLAVPDLQKAVKKFWLKRPITFCKSCDRVIFCSEACCKEAWERYHKLLCPSHPNSSVAMLYDVRYSFRNVIPTDGQSWQGWWNAQFSPTLMAKMWASIICSARSASERRQVSLHELKAASSQFDKYCNNGKDLTHEAIPKMFELMVNIFKRSKLARYEITPLEFDTRHRQALINGIQFHDTKDSLNKFANIMREDPKKYKKIGQFFAEKLPRAEFHGFFPLASLINHSCYNNVEIVSGEVDEKPGIWVKAVRDITEGQQLFIALVSPEMTKMERRKRIWSRHKFLCQCPRCVFEGDGPHQCTHCRRKAEDFESDSNVAHVRNDNNKQPGQDASSETTISSPTEGTSIIKCNERGCSQLLTDASITNKGSQDILETPESTPEVLGTSSVNTAVNPDADSINSDLSSALLSSHISSNADHQNSQKTESSNEVESLTNPKTIPCMTCAEVEAAEETQKRQTPAKLEPSEQTDAKRVKHFPHCGRCSRAWYCSQACQKDAWKKGHKLICKK
ncbi:uncharacterized protein LOC106057842 [Biomphalaria glabrata]|uniref:Uncharacterized protein LOC106057842 n=1 Tax=Biomphalaria glabrata TaxID=6526 RepID=A0A9W2Z6W8_BIOGL|nr:uncharacterized protein LOC106057842 [Biomphalaria glabrata]KAI8744968.1 SET and MYND domain-containing protein 5-like [Biomphalaria glabrata]